MAPTILAPSLTLLPISLALSQVAVANSDTPFLSVELGSENTLNPSDINPIAPPTAAPTAVPTTGITEPIAAPVIAPLAPAVAIPNASSPAPPFSIPSFSLNIDPFSAPPVKAPNIPASVVPIDSLIPAAFFSSADLPAT